MNKRIILFIIFILSILGFGIIYQIFSSHTADSISSQNIESTSSAPDTDNNIEQKTELINAEDNNNNNLDTTTEEEKSEQSIATKQETTEQGKYNPNIIAVFLGVKDYGYIDASDKENFIYKFEIDDKVSLYKIDCGAGNYKVQNKLKVGYNYDLILAPDHLNDEIPTITDVYEISISKDENGIFYTPSTETIPTKDLIISGKPGEKTIKNFLTTAMMPVGKTLYVYGGGWNWQDDGASNQSRHI